MAANKKSYDELSISEKIEAKKKKIRRLFKEMPPEKRQFADGLINQFAVTSVTPERNQQRRLDRGFRTGGAKAPAGVPGSPCLQHDD